MTREEAIKIIESNCSCTDSKLREACAMFIPELRESEDERMMREFNDWLCEEIECRMNDLRDEKDRRTLNMLCYILTNVKEWLEKQKKPHYTKRNELFDKCVENCDPEVMKEVSDKIDEMLQKEQKPSWNEEDEYVIDKVIEWAKIVNPTSTIFEKIPKERFIERLKSLRPQPKQEWDKNGEEALEAHENMYKTE